MLIRGPNVQRNPSFETKMRLTETKVRLTETKMRLTNNTSPLAHCTHIYIYAILCILVIKK